MKRLALYIDGTWNIPRNNTNVWRLYVLTAKQRIDVQQLTHYHIGVGTGRLPAVGDEVRRGASSRSWGAFGKGINNSVRNCYGWLVENYSPGDQVFIFGFSRGAFVARSLAGFIERCGLLYPGTPLTVREVFERYRLVRKGGPVSKDPYLPDVQWSLDADEELQRYSQRIEIEFLGVWDTVRYHDLPLGSWRGLSRSQNLFHVIRPAGTVRRTYHALAVDEHRRAYRPELFSVPSSADMETTTILQQRWFPGAHSNVGGGYKNDTLALLSLAWMQDMASNYGLQFKRRVTLHGDEHLGEITDSFGTFLRGAYRIAHRDRRHRREIDNAKPPGDEKAATKPTNEVIDESVFQRWHADAHYRPRNLLEWARRHNVDMARCHSSLSANQPLM